MHDDAYIGGRSENNIKCVVHDDLGRKNQTTPYILPHHWLYEWFSQFHSCETYSVLSQSHSNTFQHSGDVWTDLPEEYLFLQYVMTNNEETHSFSITVNQMTPKLSGKHSLEAGWNFYWNSWVDFVAMYLQNLHGQWQERGSNTGSVICLYIRY